MLLRALQLVVVLWAASGVTHTAEAQDNVVAVWELYSNGTEKVALLNNGTTDTGVKWSQNLLKMQIGNAGLELRNARSLGGRRAGGAPVDGRLLMLNVLLESKPAPVSPKDTIPPKPDATKKKTFADNVIGDWELIARTRKQKRQIGTCSSLSVST